MANLGINPQNDGTNIILSIPILTEERRKDLAKQTKNEGEQAKIGIRAARKSALDFLKGLKADGLSEDMEKRTGKQKFKTLPIALPKKLMKG